jgi:uncharacterized protein
MKCGWSIALAIMLLLLGCGPSGEELVRAAKEDFKNDDKEAAVEKIFKAADKKYPRGMIIAGGLYIEGELVEPDAERGFALIQEAVEMGDPDAMFAIASCYEDGEGVKASPARAKYWRKQALEKGSPLAMYLEAARLISEAESSWFDRKLDARQSRKMKSRQEERTDIKMAFELLNKIVPYDEEMRQNILMQKANVYLKGLGGFRDSRKAVALYMECVDAGNVRAAKELGRAYCDGEELRRDYDKGVELLLKGGEKDLTTWDFETLGWAYLDPNWKGFDLQTGVHYLEKVIELAESDRFVDKELAVLGRIYAYEDPIGMNRDRGIDYLKRAANQLNGEASYYLAVLYFNGEYVEQDYNKASLSLSSSIGEEGRIGDAASRLRKTIFEMEYGE